MMDIGLSLKDKELLEARGYSFVKPINEGGASTVYLMQFKINYEVVEASSFPSNVEVLLACKVVDTSKIPKDYSSKFFIRELDILSKVAHPHIIHLHSILQSKTKYMIFMRFAENGNLCDFVLFNGAVSEKLARIWIRQISVALNYLHAIELCHRDIKCENILITSKYNVKLADFGFARFVVDNKGKEYDCATFCGSLAYAPPELLRGIPYNAKLADVWSLGVVLYIMLNQSMPFNTENLGQLWASQVGGHWRFRQKVRTIVSKDVISLVTSMLDPDPEKRILPRNILKCSWMAKEPSLTKLTRLEQEALDKGLENKEEIRVRSFKKLAKTKNLDVLTKETYKEDSANLLSPSILTNANVPVDENQSTAASIDE